jgi:hypothetical protein
MAIGNSGLRYDGDGFLMGEEISQKVGTIDQNVVEILKLLQAETGQQTRRFQVTKLQRAMYEAQNAQNFERLINEVTKRTQSSNQSQHDAIDRLERAIQDQTNHSETEPSSNEPSLNSNNKPERQRDSNGRFISEHTSNDANSKRNTPNRDEKGRFIAGEAKTILKFTDVVGKFGQAVTGFGADTHGIDPTVDALHELGTVLSPVKRMAGLVFKPLTGLAKMRKRSEPLPKEQVEHNKKELRLLNEIADQSGEHSSSGLGKLFGKTPLGRLFGLGKERRGGRRGRLGRLGKLGRLLKVGRGIPLLGAALTALSFADWNEQTTAEKGGTVGALAGGSVGAIIGSLAGPVGTVVGGMVGAWVGDKLGTTVAPYFKSWTDSLTRADIPKYVLAKWSAFVDTVTQWFSHAWKSVKDGVGNFKDRTKDKITNGWNTTKAFVDRVFGGAQVTPNAKNAAKIIAKGAGFTTLQLEDGSIVRRGGSTAWRNNNFGNLNYNAKDPNSRAKRFGAIGEDSNGFAVFPNAEAGMKAHEDLLFNGHADSSLHQMVKSYAPKNDPRGKNDPEGYWHFIMQEAGVTDKRMADYSKEERQRIMKAMYKKEGVHAGPEQIIKQAVQAPEVESPAAGEAYTSAAVAPQSNSLIAKNSNSAAATSVAPIQMPKTNVLKIESLTARANSPSPQKVMVVDQNDMNMIAQDIGDPQLAMALTGGIGRA